MILRRDLEKILKQFAKFPAIALLGPRQSGKTTLSKEIFKKHVYVTLEDPEILSYITQDPKRFLRENENKHGIILDEFQHAPQFLSYLQIEIDEKNRPGYFVLTGSQNFLMPVLSAKRIEGNEAITQTLAGRVGILHLLPLSIHELTKEKLIPSIVDDLIFKGGYPRIHAQKFSPRELFPSYIRTYIERDVRQLTRVENLMTFQKFMQLCAGRVGQELNVADLATNCGISRNTAQHWLSLLEASYIIFLLKPYYKNYSKRITKKPKLYFYDTGLACSFLGIRTIEELSKSLFRGPLFECLIIADFFKQFYNLGLEPRLYYWRDQNGRIEIDCLIDIGLNVIPVEMKSGETIVNDFFGAIAKWSELAQIDPSPSYIIYGGTSHQRRKMGTVKSWLTAGKLISDLEKNI